MSSEATNPTPDLSVVIPAHNEERYLPKCLAAIAFSRDKARLRVETVVVLNRCTDGTERIATDFGAMVVREDAKNIARIRNVGVSASNASIIATIDADSYMSENTLGEVAAAAADIDVVAGGANFEPERKSIPILLSYGLSKWMARRAGGSMAFYWFRRWAFDTIGGFDERRHIGEDIDFSSRLRRYAEASGLSYHVLKDSHVTTSCRKFDEFGSWYAIRLALFHRTRVRSMMDGSNAADMDKYYYALREQKARAEDSD